MSQKKIIKPEGEAIWKYLNDGYAICNECGALMDQTTDPETGYAVFKCPACGGPYPYCKTSCKLFDE